MTGEKVKKSPAPKTRPETREGPESAPSQAVEEGPLGAGLDVIRNILKTLPNSPGVYRMISQAGDVLYVGKAKSLKKRVASYTRESGLGNRIARMVSQTRSMEIVTTHSEVEALLLESNLIKSLKPRYNVLLRDDKSFPYIFIGRDHQWPQVTKHRGARKRKGDYFGPFASAGAVNETMNTLERAFLLRSCPDTVFANRSRPCLLHQIKRCSAPCVERISQEDYDALTEQARAFLKGEGTKIQEQLARRMEAASDAMDYETAALYRDRIKALSLVHSHQDINNAGLGDADVIAAAQSGGKTCIQVFFFRAGRNHGNRAYFPRHDGEAQESEVLSAFIGQFYDEREAPKLVLVSHEVAERALKEDALALKAGHKVRLTTPQRGIRKKLIAHALANAREALGRHWAENATEKAHLQGVAETFGLEAPPKRIEVYDNSHIQGAQAVGAMIVAGTQGMMKKAYRKFNIKTTAPEGNPAETNAETTGYTTATNDDYAMMRQVMTRRFTRLLTEDPDRTSDQWPDLLLIDGGAGHLGAVTGTLNEMGLSHIPVAAIAKGVDRNAGRERFFLPGRAAFSLPMRDPVLFYLQRLRDEAHRFAIGSHRTRRKAALTRSVLDEISGIGGARKKALLHHFGSARGVAAAGLPDLMKVPGIDKGVAQKIYAHFHESG